MLIDACAASWKDKSYFPIRPWSADTQVTVAAATKLQPQAVKVSTGRAKRKNTKKVK